MILMLFEFNIALRCYNATFIRSASLLLNATFIVRKGRCSILSFYFTLRGMAMIDFFYVSPEFINFLKKSEQDTRGFTRIPNIEYAEDQHQKFVLGVVLTINGFKYYAPVTHYKKQMPNNILINIKSDIKNPVKGSVRFNYMFPVLDKYITKAEINRIADVKYRRLVYKELRFCIENEDKIYKTALRTYLEVILGTDKELKDNSVDFKLLENALTDLPLPDITEDTGKDHILV